MRLEMLAFNYKVYEECRLSGPKGLNRLLELRAQKESLKGQFQTVDLVQKAK